MQNIEHRILDLKEAAEKLSIRIETANLNDHEFAIQSGFLQTSWRKPYYSRQKPF
jgi:hypothetical protein